MTALLAACALVIPTANVGIDHGRVLTYADHGDRIAYSARPTPTFRALVEGVRGRGLRVRCN